MKIENQQVHLPLLSRKKVELYIKREDKIHPFVSGNKFRKLKYNLIEAQTRQADTILTFGGAYSNHIAASAYAAAEKGFKSLGVIRGEELVHTWRDNPTLRFAYDHGMRFHFVSRERYRAKYDVSFLEDLQATFGAYYLIPEGGTNQLAIDGCQEILVKGDNLFNIICSSVGTGGTLSGLIKAAGPEQRILGFPALRGDFLKEDIRKFVQRTNWELQTAYHFGGYAKTDALLIDFINDFKRQTRIPLDPVYTGKMIFGILDLVQKDFFRPKTKILAIHTGGLQGIAGMNAVLKKKNLPQLDV